MEAVQRFIQMLKDSAIMRQQVYQLLFALLTLIGAQVDLSFIEQEGEAIVDGVLTLASAAVAILTMFTRATKPAPNLTEAAKANEVKLVEQGTIPVEKASVEAASVATSSVSESVTSPPMQGGFARTPVLIALVVLSACTLLGVPSPETFNQRAAFALTQVTAVRESATELVSSGAITADDAQNIQQQADSARAGIDLALVFKATDPENAENRLAAANVVIDALKAYLQKQVDP